MHTYQEKHDKLSDLQLNFFTVLLKDLKSGTRSWGRSAVALLGLCTLQSTGPLGERSVCSNTTLLLLQHSLLLLRGIDTSFCFTCAYLHSFRGTPLSVYMDYSNINLALPTSMVSSFAVKSAVKRMLGKYLQPDFVKRIQHEVDMYNHLGRWAQLPKLDLFSCCTVWDKAAFA